MSNSYTPQIRLAKPATADRNWDIPIRANLDLIDALAPVGGLAVSTTETPSIALTVAVAAGTYQKSDATVGNYAGASPIAVPVSATTALWLTDAGVLTQGTAFPTTPHVRLASVTTDASRVTAIADARVAYQTLASTPGGGAPTGASYVVLATDPTLTAERVLTGTPNRVTVTDGGAGAAVTLSTPQDLHTAAVPTFAGVKVSVATKTAAYTLTDADSIVLADATGGAFAITLPTAVGRGGRPFTVKRINAGSNAVTLASGGGTIDGATTQALATQNASLTVVSDGTNWFIV